MHVNKLKMFIPLCSFILSARVSLPKQWLMTTWNKQMSTILCKNLSQCCCSKHKIPELWKGLYVNCCDFFSAEDFVSRIGMMLLITLTPLQSPDIFITTPQEARKGKSWGGTSKRASKQILQNSVLSVHCLQTNEQPRNKMHIHLGYAWL